MTNRKATTKGGRKGTAARASKGSVTRLPAEYPTWDDCFTYRKFHEDTLDGRDTARRISKALASPQTPREVKREIEVGVTLMMLAAGMQLAPHVPLDVCYLAAHQHVQNYYGGLTLATVAEVTRQLAITRAAMIVTTALVGLKKRRAGAK